MSQSKSILFTRRFPRILGILMLMPGFAMAAPQAPAKPETATKQAPAKPAAAAKQLPEKPAAAPTKTDAPPVVPAPAAETQPQTPPPAEDSDDEAAAEAAEAEAAIALPVNPEPVRIYGWREYVLIAGVQEKLLAKLDTGALTSSIHAEEKELFERDGKKWVRFIVTDVRQKKPVRTRIEAPLVRTARIKEPNSESVAREVVRLSFQIGERKLRGEFTLNNRNNMLAPLLIGRSTLKDLGWVDPARTHIAEQKISR